MNELSPKARALVAAGRAGYSPGAGDRARVAAALRAQLGTQVLPPESLLPAQTSIRPASTALSAKSVAGLALGVCLAGGALFFALRPRASSSRPPLPVTTTASPAPTEPSTPANSANTTVVPSGASSLPVASALPSPSSARTDRLAQEIALLSRATSALRAGRAGDALALLNEHQREFPRGALSQERRAAKAQALCALGRRTEGRAELARLAPGSPAAVRAQQGCSVEQGLPGSAHSNATQSR